jgi:hypothetical protein
LIPPVKRQASQRIVSIRRAHQAAKRGLEID